MKIVFILFFIPFALFADLNITKEMKDIKKTVSTGYYFTLNEIDCYLGDYNDTNGSNYKAISKNKLYMIFSLQDNRGKFKGSVRFRGKIELPQLKNRFEVTFSKQEDNQRENEQIDSESEDMFNDQNFHVGLKYYAYKEFHSKAYAKLSLSLHSHLGLYTKIGMDKSYFMENYQLIFDHGLYYYINEDNFAFSTSMTFFTPFGMSNGIEQKNRWYWEKDEDRAVLENSLSIFQIVDLKNRLRYKLTYASIDDDIDNYDRYWYGASVKYHHQISGSYFVELMGEVLKERKNNFKFDKIITLNFGMTLSK
jgi:hypothetical protein